MINQAIPALRVILAGTLLCPALAHAQHATLNAATVGTTIMQPPSPSKREALGARELSILPITAFTATGDVPALGLALEQGLDAGLTISEVKEILVQMYAYTGYSRHTCKNHA